MIEFKEWPKTPRLLRDITITEKIDGTNAAIGIVPLTPGEDPDPSIIARVALSDQSIMGIYAQSRTRLITPGKLTDNYGFAGWVQQNAAELVDILGEGLHFGEWWGNGIQRNYGMAEKWFSLFNTARFHGFEERTSLNLRAVPVLYQGPHDTEAIAAAMTQLREWGSEAAPGFMNPEGICVYHAASRTISKVTLDKNDAGKWENAAVTETSGVSFAGLLFLLFLGLQLAGVIAWPWVWAFAPLWIPALTVLVVILIMLIAAWIEASR